MIQNTEQLHLYPEQAFRLLLQTEFVRRCKKNSSYSMRAFAKFLEIDQSLLSKIMRNERTISKMNMSKIGEKIGMTPSQVETLLNKKSLATEFTALADDVFNVISDWHHFAILELIKIKNFKSDYSFISKKINLHIDEVRYACERLQRLDLISVENDKISLKKRNNTWSNNQKTTEARRRLQKSLTELSLKALDEVPFEHRDHGSLTLAINSKRLPEFKEKLSKIRQELGDFFQGSEDLNEVYQLTIAFFPLTQINQKETEI